MPSGEAIQFWFSIASTYSYLTISRLDEVSKRTGIAFQWRPFRLRTITQEQNNTPFRGKPIKSAYMWRDIERRASMYGLPVKVPAPYPIVEVDLANLIAMVGVEEGWCPAYTRATYRRWFVDGLEPGSEPNLSASLQEIGQDAQRVIAKARTEATAAALTAATDEARSLNLFGAPSFVTRGELFWGDDRLDDAIAWHKHGKLG
ncbi:MAG: 2-hydroxychromene-2-carboxylate isomerase [Hyphomicrobiaceae bacterium]